MYYLNKTVGWLLSPLGIGLILLAVSWVSGMRRFGKLSRFSLFLAFVGFWIFSCSFFTLLIGLPLEGEEIDVATLPSADAIVLLGGGMSLHEQCGRPEICSGADRAWTAAKLFKAGKAPVLTVSGGAAAAEIAFLSDMGVDTNKIISLETARNTEEEAKLIREVLLKRPGTERTSAERKSERKDTAYSPRILEEELPDARVLVVTSAWHMPRAKMLFERIGFEVVAAPTDYEAHCKAECPREIGSFFPNADALNRNSYLFKEWVAHFCYWIKGGCR